MEFVFFFFFPIVPDFWHTFFGIYFVFRICVGASCVIHEDGFSVLEYDFAHADLDFRKHFARYICFSAVVF